MGTACLRRCFRSATSFCEQGERTSEGEVTRRSRCIRRRCGGALAGFLTACQTCLQANSCPSHSGSNGGQSQFSFNGRLWAEGIYAHGLGNIVVPPNSPYPYCQIETGDSDTDSSGVYGLTSYHPGGANVAMIDGSVRFIKNTVAYIPFWALGSINQGYTENSNVSVVTSPRRPETIASSDAPSPAMMSLSINFLAANWARS